MTYVCRFLVVLFCVYSYTNLTYGQWVKGNGPYSAGIGCFAVNGTNLYAGAGASVFHSSNSGSTWTSVSSGLPNASLNALAVSGSSLFAGTVEGVYRSTDNGNSWKEVDSGLTNIVVVALASSGGLRIAAS